MNYQSSSRSQKKRSSPGSDTILSSRQITPPTSSVTPNLRYFTAAASSSIPYESPYAQNQDRRSQPPTDSSVRSVSTTTRTHRSKQSPSSSDDSIYDSPGSCGSRYTTPGGIMSTQRTMSSVSQLWDLCFAIWLHSCSTTSCNLVEWTKDCFEINAVRYRFRGLNAQ